MVVADLNGEGAEAVAGELGAAARGVRVDVSVDAEVAGLAQAAMAFGGRIDILVNNAGVGQGRRRWKRSAKQPSTGCSRSTPSRFT